MAVLLSFDIHQFLFLGQIHHTPRIPLTDNNNYSNVQTIYLKLAKIIVRRLINANYIHYTTYLQHN